MPQRSSIQSLPEEVKGELDRRLVGGGFAGYRELAEWLAGAGFEISKSSLHRYGQQFEERLGLVKIATEQARAIADEARDDEGAMNDALIRLVQQKAFDVLMALESEQAAEDTDLVGLGMMVSKLGQAAVAQKKWQDQVRRRAEAAADRAEAVARKGGLSPEAVRTIRQEILGVAG